MLLWASESVGLYRRESSSSVSFVVESLLRVGK